MKRKKKLTELTCTNKSIPVDSNSKIINLKGLTYSKSSNNYILLEGKITKSLVCDVTENNIKLNLTFNDDGLCSINTVSVDGTLNVCDFNERFILGKIFDCPVIGEFLGVGVTVECIFYKNCKGT